MAYNLSQIDCKVNKVIEKKDLLTFKILEYEFVISCIESIGEQGFYQTIYYDKELPTQEELIKDLIMELTEMRKKKNYLVAGIYAPSGKEENWIKGINRILRLHKKL